MILYFYLEAEYKKRKNWEQTFVTFSFPHYYSRVDVSLHAFPTKSTNSVYRYVGALMYHDKVYSCVAYSMHDLYRELDSPTHTELTLQLITTVNGKESTTNVVLPVQKRKELNGEILR